MRDNCLWYTSLHGIICAERQICSWLRRDDFASAWIPTPLRRSILSAVIPVSSRRTRNDTTRHRTNAECLRHQSCLYPDTEVRVLVVSYNNTVVLVSSRIGRTCTALRIKLPGGLVKSTIANLNSSFKQLLSSLTHFAYPRYVFKDYWHHSPGS